MPFSTFGVATAVTPSVIETYFSHFFNRKPLKEKPTAHISYHEGLRLIRQFLDYSSKHPVEDLQHFTAQWVPAPTWVRIQDVEIPPQFLKRSANVLRKQLGSHGIERIGGEEWWQWRRLESPLHAEWIEMKKDYNQRKRDGAKCNRVILYVHGGAYYFGSVDEHRYQMQRHARKLKARVLAPRYRLAPQFPFPCGLYDCIAAYFYLLEHFEPSQVLFAGDSAGGGMVLGMLTTLRDQGCPLPAGTILLSPWVDLTHSFPSVAGEGTGDYIPPHGFHHKPSMAWPPPPQTEKKAKQMERKFTQPNELPFEVVELPADTTSTPISVKPGRDNLRETAHQDAQKIPPELLNSLPGMGDHLEITIDQNKIRVKEQFQMYAPNELLSHPLVSPVQQPSLGGLPPMLIQVGGAELLRDEQIYLAHKAANPRAYPPGQAIMNEHDPQRVILNQYPATDVQLQIWEDLCHVPHTLSFTRPAKYMYRSVAQFGAWALARAQHKGIDILDDDAISIISDGEGEGTETGGRPESDRFSTYGSIGIEEVSSSQFNLTSVGVVGKAGDQLPPFKDHMIRQRVNRHGLIFPLPHPSEIACLNLDPNTIGALKAGPVRKWLAKRKENELKFAKDYRSVLKKRAKELKEGYDPMENGEQPPATALVNRRRKGVAPEEKKKGKSWGLAMWSGWGSSHDESTIYREEKAVNDKLEGEAQAREEAASSSAERTVSIAPSTNTVKTRASSKDAEKVDAAMSALAAAGFGGIATTSRKLSFPSKEARTAETKARRRTSGASFLSRPRDRPKSPYTKVRDAGQAISERGSSSAVVSPGPGSDGAGFGKPTSARARNNSGSIGAWDQFSRRSSGASGTGKLALRDRPGSVAAAVASALEDVPQSPTSFEHAPSAPSTSDTRAGKDAVNVLGTDNTFLNPDSSRPHNGTVAYPFKLRNAHPVGVTSSPNPSTMTLDSAAQSDREMPASGASVTSNEETPGVPDSTLVESNAVPVESPTDRQGPAQAETAAPPEHVTSPAAAMPRPESTTLGVPVRPISMLPSNSSAYRHLKSPEDDPVSPLETPTPTSAASEPSSSTQLPFQRRNKYETRDSKLGFLGADGMPTAAWPERFAQTSEKKAGSAPKPAPFKIRNPVYDARVAPNQAPAVVAQQPQQPEPAADAPKPAPFKMRHVVYDSKVAPPGGLAAGSAPASSTATAAANAAAGSSGSEAASVAANREVSSASNTFHSQAPAPTESPVIRPTTREESSPTNTSSSGNEYPEISQSNVSESSTPKANPAIRLDTSGPPPPVPPKDEPASNPATTHSSSGSTSRSTSVKRKALPPTSKFSTTSDEHLPSPPPPPTATEEGKKSPNLPGVVSMSSLPEVTASSPLSMRFSFETPSSSSFDLANRSTDKFHSPLLETFVTANENLQSVTNKHQPEDQKEDARSALEQAGWI
ncbi:AB hydrolase superfamily [Lecanosticta acicola]|uniref:AB hydrolase superfamily n=1 Tax=Lecanosticta acicola TaxID=111012 RepID=A0AAI8YSN8_9PEZI|nr:AB hydrolase superfamily [Lecanosticta acicola]